MPVIFILLLLFITVPLVEISVLGTVMSEAGIATTLALCVLTAALGALLVRIEGIQTLQRVQERMRAGDLPAAEMLEGLSLFLAGLMLLTPGFVTDAVGFLILTPWVRRPIARALAGRMHVRGHSGHHGAGDASRGREGGGPTPPGRIIDVEVDSQDDR